MKSNHKFRTSFVLAMIAIFLISGCVSKKRKNDVSKLGKFYHNVTSEYNGYFNANELYEASLATLKANNNDNYSKILEVYDYIAVPDPKVVNPDLDKAIEKLTKVATIHEKGDWVDDCYVLMAKSQFLKQDYERAQETLEYFEEDFNPANPYGRNFQKKKLNAQLKKDQAEKKKEETEKKKEEAKEKKEEEAKAREKLREEKADAKKDAQKAREKEKKEKAKAKKDKRKSVKSKSEVKKDSTQTKTTPVNNVIKNNAVTPVNKEAEPEPELPKKPEATKKDKTSYSEGLLMLARTYTRTEQYSSAEFLLDKLEKTPGITDEVAEQLAPAQADLMLKQKDYPQALTYLDKAIESSGKKNDRARYAFIAGQIQQMNKDMSQAVHYYSKAKDLAKDFKLKFMSELSLAKANAASGGKSSEQIIKQLEKFLKEDKYAEFKDQIYFSLGEVAMGFDKKKAKEYFTNSSIFNTNNASLKTESCYMLAQLNLEDKEYNRSKLYFDTTLVALPTVDDRYTYVKNMASNLSSIAANIQIVEKYDSLLVMGELSNDELQKIAKRRLEAEKSSGKKTETKGLNRSGLISNPVSKSYGAGFSNFFAYNLSLVESGKTAFKNTWGSRKLEDNWRRSVKTYNQNSEEDIAEKTKNNEVSEEMSDAEYKRIMADVPLNSFQKEQYKTELKKALFALGKDYRDKIQEYGLSAETLEKLVTQYPGLETEAESFYYLLLDYNDLNNTEMANKYKALLISKYPDDKFSKIVSDPNFLNALTADAKKLDLYYDQSYELFQKGQYSKVVTRVQSAIEAFGKDNKLVAKFSLLNAMCLGATQGKEAYIKGLQEVVVRYPKTPEETKAKEIMRFLVGDATAFDNVNIDEAEQMYDLENDGRHYVAVIILSYDADVFDASKIAVSEYNKKYHGPENLQLGESVLSKEEKTQLILIRSFDNKAKAMKYYDGVMTSKETFLPPSIAGFEIFPITTKNYRKMVQDKSHNKYRAFFEKKYLGK